MNTKTACITKHHQNKSSLRKRVFITTNNTFVVWEKVYPPKNYYYSNMYVNNSDRFVNLHSRKDFGFMWTYTGCPISKVSKRNGYNLVRKHIWPHINKVKMCLKDMHFCWQKQLFVYKKYKNTENGKCFNQASMV